MNFGGVINSSMMDEEMTISKAEMPLSQRSELRAPAKISRPQSAGLRGPTKKVKQQPEAVPSKLTLIQNSSEAQSTNALDKN